MRTISDKDIALRVQRHMPNLPLEDILRGLDAIKRRWADGLAEHKKCLIWPIGRLVPRRRRKRLFWSAVAMTQIKTKQHRAVIFRPTDRGRLILALLDERDPPPP